MKRNLLAVATLAVVGMLLAGAAEKKDDSKKVKAPYVHTVVFTLKKDAPGDEQAQMIADCHAMLGKIPAVRELRVGRPAEKGTPRLANKDFSVALTIFFDDYDGLMAYDKHDLHKKFVEKHIQHVELDKLKVYDFE